MEKGARKSFLASPNLDGARLDKTIHNQFPDWGRQAVKALIENRQVRVNGRLVWLASWKVKAGDKIEVSNPPDSKPRSHHVFDPEWLVADEGDLLVVNKPAGLRAQETLAGGVDNLLRLAQNAFGDDIRLFHRSGSGYFRTMPSDPSRTGERLSGSGIQKPVGGKGVCSPDFGSRTT
ncbi:MAG: hypothetical protein JW757_01875 [Anaerolineales bacterium]|nr:hypothetical protein [Anaerolineales bacterium]